MELAPLIEALSDPSAYGEGVDAVEVHQTHISAVFLAGALAYKIKKPVSPGFLDYSTLERRRHCCEEEVRLNRRLALDVYLGVVPVTRDAGRIRVEGTGELVEWAVKMRRLPEAATLRARIADGRVAPEAMAELARRLARFYDDAQGGPAVVAHCRFAAIAANVRENLKQADSQVGEALSRSTHDRLRERSAFALERLHTTIESRAARGVPRDTHGDLRLEHVYWFPERPSPGDWVVVDGIEFDDRYRHADPVADIAFLAMELELEGRGDLASAFVEAYFPAAGDDEGRQVLPLYRSYRAAVRGKVEGMKLAEPEIPEADRASARVRARALWLHALSVLEEPGRRPCLILLAGLPGTGKSTLARALAERAGFIVVRSDEVRKELAAAASEAQSPDAFASDVYTPEWDERTYAACLERAGAIVFDAGRAMIDASFRDESRRRQFLEAARRWGVTGRMLLLRADPEVVRHRLEHRRDDASDAGWEVYLEAVRRWGEVGVATGTVTDVIEAGGPASRTLDDASEALARAGLLGPCPGDAGP